MCLCRPYVCLINYEHVPVLLVSTIVFRANYKYISLDSMEKFLSYEPKEASPGVTTVASSTAGTIVFFKKRNSTKS